MGLLKDGLARATTSARRATKSPFVGALACAAVLHLAALHTVTSRPPAPPPAPSAEDVQEAVLFLIEALDPAQTPKPAASGEAGLLPDAVPRAGRATSQEPEPPEPGRAPRPARAEASPSLPTAPADEAQDDRSALVPSPFAQPEATARPAVRFELTPAEAARSLLTEPRRSPAAPGSRIPSNEELTRRLQTNLRDHQVDHDRKTGVGAGGVAAAALREATLGPRAPQEGDAVFSVETDAAGRVTGLRLLSGSEAWEPVAQQAFAALSGRIITRAASLRMRIQVRARYQFPSGSKKRAQLKLPLQDPPGSQAPPMGTGLPAPRHAAPPPAMHDHRDWWEGSPNVSRSFEMLHRLSIGVVADPADLAAKAQQRVVSVVVLDEAAR